MDPWNLTQEIVSQVVAADAGGTVEAVGQAANSGADGGVSLLPIAAAVSMAVTILAAGFTIKGIAQSAIEGATRQPDVQAKLQTQMIVAIAFIEGLSIIALIFGGLLLHN